MTYRSRAGCEPGPPELRVVIVGGVWDPSEPAEFAELECGCAAWLRQGDRLVLPTREHREACPLSGLPCCDDGLLLRGPRAVERLRARALRLLQVPIRERGRGHRSSGSRERR